MQRTLKRTALALLLGAGALIATSGTASAYVACNASGECWHTDARVHYDRGLGIVIHPDDWYFHHDMDRDHWRGAHAGRGYYKNGVWLSF